MAYKRRENLETLMKHYLSPDIKPVLKVNQSEHDVVLKKPYMEFYFTLANSPNI